MVGHVHGATSGRLLWISLALTVAFVVVELFWGLRAHSLALVSDAGHNASDALALGLAAYAVWVARRPASSHKTFGYHRVAILTALANAVALVVIALAILWEAWQTFLHPTPPQGTVMIVVAAIAVLLNTLIAYWLRGESHHSLNARAAYIHMAGDALSALGVVIAGFAVKYFGWTLADPLVSVLIAAFILYSSWGVIREATDVLLESTPRGLNVDALVAAMRETPAVQDVHDLHVWTVSDGLHFLSCHVVLPDACTMAQASETVATLNRRLQDEFSIGHATIQAELAGGDVCAADDTALYCGTMESHGHTGCTH